MIRTTAKTEGRESRLSRVARGGFLLVCFLMPLLLALPALAGPAQMTPPASLASLLLVPNDGEINRTPSTDESLAAAVAQGNEPGLERKNPFRKKSFDLFRTEHDVEIMRQEMRVRFRLRPKSRETMTVEFKF